MSNSRSFDDLLHDLRQGDEQAARQVVEEYTAALVAVARRQMGAKLHRRLDPEDIIQSTYRSLFVRMRQGEYELGSGRDLWKLLVTITLNKVRGQAKFHGSARRNMDVERQLSQTAEPAGERGGGPSAADAAALVDELQTLLAGLSERDRAIAELRLQGCSTEEIAKETGRAERSVRRVLQHLRDRLSNQTAD